MDLPLTLFFAATANFLGDVILFCLARYQKQSVKPYLVGHRRKIALIHLFMKRHCFIILIVKKYIYGFRTLVPIVAAFVNYPLDRFMLYNILGACIWSISIGVCAYYLGEILVGIFDSFPKYSGYIIPLIVVVLLFVLWKWLGSKSNKNHGMYFKK